MEDEEIVKMFLRREETAIAHSKDKYGQRLQNISFGITADRQTAEEVENDTYYRAWESIPPNEPYGYLFAFLAKIARNLSLSVCRNRSRLKRSAYVVELSEEMQQCIPSGENVEERLNADILAETVSSFLRSKPKEKREVFMRRYWFLDPTKSIAKRFGMTESSVKTTLFRLRKELKEYLEREGYTV
ncbi:MAG: RNA polymerase sigma factor [Bacteroides sp.]|nr:RNA polymerase sigma factor [Bacteroides sp.]